MGASSLSGGWWEQKRKLSEGCPFAKTTTGSQENRQVLQAHRQASRGPVR